MAIQDFLNNRFSCLTCEADASHHCCFCDFDFCPMCKDFHQENGLKKHEWVDIVTYALSLKEKAMQMCRTCKESIPAKAFCVTCVLPSPMCELCCLEHTNQYLDHYLCYDMENIETNDEEKISISKSYFCAPCSFDGDENDATVFCLTCEEPELMCNECAEQHIRERKSRGHELCYNIEQFFNMSISKVLLCESCQEKGDSQTAIAFCLTCKHPEPFCDACVNTHSHQEQCHEISYHIQLLKKWLPCEPCMFSKTENASTHFCMDCEEPEPMCKTCANQHLKMRPGRGHILCNDIGKFPGHANAQFRILPR